MSTPIRQNPAERVGTRQSRDLQAKEDAARQLNREGLDAASDNPTTARQGTARLSALVDQATGRTQSTPQTEEGRGTSTVGAAGAAPLNRAHTVDELGAHQQVFGTGETRLGPPTTPRVQLTANQVTGAQSFAHNLDHAMGKALENAGRMQAMGQTRAADAPTGNTTDGRLVSSGIRGLGPDELLSEFLKLNINDPNENVETHNKLSEVSTLLRKQAISDAKKQSENAQKMMKEAEAYAKQAQMISTVVQVASIALTICTFGAGAVVAVPAAMAAQGATVAAQGVVQAMLTTAQNMASAVASSISNAVANAAAQIGSSTAATTAEAVVQSTTEAAVQGFVQANQAAFQQMVQQTIDQAAQQGIQLTTQQAETAVMQQLYNQFLPQVTQQLAANPAMVSQFGSEAITQAGGKLAQEAATRSATTGMQGFINRAGDVLSNMNTGSMTKVSTAAQAVGQGVAAGARYKAAEKMADARQAGLEVTRSRFRAEQAQAQIEQENELINTIMESKNQTIDAVMQMTNATWASRQQLLAATMAR